jgi:N-acetylmuramoyl-L-alanine amidase
MNVVISSGHGKYVRGASGYIDEVDEARKVVEAVAHQLRELGVGVETFHDDVSQTQNENLERIVSFHNSQIRDLDVSVHFNAYVETSEPMGCEVLFVTNGELAADVSAAIAQAARLIDRGAKQRNDLYFLSNTDQPAILIETLFVDSAADTDLYLDRENFDAICCAIAETIAARYRDAAETERRERQVAVRLSGRCSWFGGPDDDGVDADEGLAFFYEYDDAPHLLLEKQPPGTTGLARRLNPDVKYVACRWDYDITSKDMLADPSYRALVRSPKTGKEFLAWPADWGPHEDTDRVADISPGLMEALGIDTDDEIELIYPAPTAYGRNDGVA